MDKDAFLKRENISRDLSGPTIEPVHEPNGRKEKNPPGSQTGAMVALGVTCGSVAPRSSPSPRALWPRGSAR